MILAYLIIINSTSKLVPTVAPQLLHVVGALSASLFQSPATRHVPLLNASLTQMPTQTPGCLLWACICESVGADVRKQMITNDLADVSIMHACTYAVL
jgi:hypothetical protein